MPKRIPISAAKRFADDNECRQVVIAAWDGDLVHVVTYGKTAEDCDNAAAAGDRYKAALGWPEQLNAKPSRLKKAEARAEAAESRLSEYEAVVREAKEALDLDAAVHAAAVTWCGEKGRETFLSDMQYFEWNWQSLPGLADYVDRELGRRARATLARIATLEAKI